MNRKPIHTAHRVALPLALALALTADISLAGDGYGSKAPSVPQLFDLLVTAEECAPIDEHACGESCTTSWKAGEKLAGLIVRDSASFAEFTPLFRARFDAESTTDHGRSRLIGFLAECSSKDSIALGEQLLESAPAVFSDGQLVSFAAMGSERFQQRLLEDVKHGKSETVLPAAYLAFRGEAVGRPALVRASEAEIDASNVHEALLAAAALDALDALDTRPDEPRHAQPRAVDTVLLRVQDTALAQLDRGDLEAARGLALAARVITKQLSQQASGSSGFSLNNLQTQVAWTLRSEAARLASAEQVFDVIEELAPIS